MSAPVQMRLFDEEPKGRLAPRPELSEWALVYMCTLAGGNNGNLFLLNVEDAKLLCSDACSKGVGRGGPWHFQWTTIDHFTRQNETYDNRLEDFVFIRDTGKQDADFERLGIRKPTRKEQADVLKSIGYLMVEKAVAS